jgi:predicted Zn-dependent protease
MMFRALVVLLVALTASTIASAAAYGNHDPRRILVVAESAAGKRYGVDTTYLDTVMADLTAHAKSYPPAFDTPQDRQRATQDVRVLTGMLDRLVNGPDTSPELLVRAAHLHGIGHNLEIPGSAEKANGYFLRLLAAVPDEPRGNFMYGTFLAGVGKGREAIPYLDKALALGVVDAAYALGLTQLSIGEKDKAVLILQEYKRRKPGDPNIDRLIKAARSGSIEVQKHTR